ncbi:hypothetical protein LguiB_022089 [Lonicera macranthoides]
MRACAPSSSSPTLYKPTISTLFPFSSATICRTTDRAAVLPLFSIPTQFRRPNFFHPPM